jgi:hypothetical protein
VLKVIYKGEECEAHITLRESLFKDLRESYPQKVVVITDQYGNNRPVEIQELKLLGE